MIRSKNCCRTGSGDKISACPPKPNTQDKNWGLTATFAVKPDPAVYRHVAGLLGVAPEDTLYCGDSDVDIRFAHNAGARGVGCLWGFRGRAELEAAGADFLAECPLDILSCL